MNEPGTGRPRGSRIRRELADPLVRAGVVLGVGFGGFADGIVLHQILGWHHLICVTADCQVATLGQLQRQVTQDGYFHLALWLISLGGVALLWRAARAARTAWRGADFVGALLIGAGLFNVVEGVIDHHLLGIHHVLPGHADQLWFDVAFLAVGVALIAGGLRCLRWTGTDALRDAG